MNQYLRIKTTALALVTLLAMTACGAQHQAPIDLNERIVPVETGSSTQASTDDLSDIKEDVSRELNMVVPAAVPVMDLKSKILSTSNVPQRALDNAFAFYNKNQSILRNQRFMTIFDIGQHSGKPRLYLIDLSTGVVKQMQVAHGSGSDSNNDGIATDFSNVSGSNKSSLGFMMTAETYIGKHGESLRLDGLESRNSQVRARAIVVHSASYVNANLSKMGRSWGCPAVSLDHIQEVISKIKGGSLYYIYHEKYN